jgi:hypothetical protein
MQLHVSHIRIVEVANVLVFDLVADAIRLVGARLVAQVGGCSAKTQAFIL